MKSTIFALIGLFVFPVLVWSQSTIIGTRPAPPTGSLGTVPLPGALEFPATNLDQRQREWIEILAMPHTGQLAGFRNCRDVVATLRSMGLPVILDQTAIDDSLTEKDMLKIELTNVPLHDALDVALRNKNATLLVRPGGVSIISLDVAMDPEFFSTITYDISPLATNGPELVEHIKRFIDPSGWDDTNGDGVIEFLGNGSQKYVTVSNSTAVQRQVRDYLKGLFRLQGIVPQSRDKIAVSRLSLSRIIRLPGETADGKKRKKPRGQGIGGYGGGGGVF